MAVEPRVLVLVLVRVGTLTHTHYISRRVRLSRRCCGCAACSSSVPTRRKYSGAVTC
ncbi:unnamed protein product [Ectocarpus sp. CCAP 1310/34]|nr:unnamed protein product [Ectocarpus sp. CCAP 1310/34]